MNKIVWKDYVEQKDCIHCMILKDLIIRMWEIHKKYPTDKDIEELLQDMTTRFSNKMYARGYFTEGGKPCIAIYSLKWSNQICDFDSYMIALYDIESHSIIVLEKEFPHINEILNDWMINLTSRLKEVVSLNQNIGREFLLNNVLTSSFNEVLKKYEGEDNYIEDVDNKSFTKIYDNLSYSDRLEIQCILDFVVRSDLRHHDEDNIEEE